MNTIYTIISLLVLFVIGLNPAYGHAKSTNKGHEFPANHPGYSIELIEKRINEASPIFEVQLNKGTRKLIKSYLQRGRNSTAHILGRASIYFPIIEHYLAERQMPDDIKYLAVIESALKPTAKSKAGAVGLWQFMPSTAKEYGLRIDDYIDERLDLYRSTEAAIQFLSDLHQRYQDWALAIAAYNCGPGKVDKVIKKAGSKHFWTIKKHLPKQTQRYVEKFIAATYAMDNYLFYDIHPKYPDYSLQLTMTTNIYTRKSFRQIAKETGISIQVIQQLNPAYKKAIIPPNEKGYYLLLPRIGLNDDWQKVITNNLLDVAKK